MHRQGVQGGLHCPLRNRLRLAQIAVQESAAQALVGSKQHRKRPLSGPHWLGTTTAIGPAVSQGTLAGWSNSHLQAAWLPRILESQPPDLSTIRMAAHGLRQDRRHTARKCPRLLPWAVSRASTAPGILNLVLTQALRGAPSDFRGRHGRSLTATSRSRSIV